jgi:hypothetical protein
MAPSFSSDSLFRHGLVTTLLILLGLAVVFIPGRGWLGSALLASGVSAHFWRNWWFLHPHENRFVVDWGRVGLGSFWFIVAVVLFSIGGRP